MKYKDIDVLDLQLLVYINNIDIDNDGLDEFLEKKEEDIIKFLSKNNITGNTEINCDDMVEIYLDKIKFNHFGIHKFLKVYNF